MEQVDLVSARRSVRPSAQCLTLRETASQDGHSPSGPSTMAKPIAPFRPFPAGRHGHGKRTLAGSSERRRFPFRAPGERDTPDDQVPRMAWTLLTSINFLAENRSLRARLAVFRDNFELAPGRSAGRIDCLGGSGDHLLRAGAERATRARHWTERADAKDALLLRAENRSAPIKVAAAPKLPRNSRRVVVMCAFPL
jgi:hypothetical protein